jgi:hypothetical protein
VQQFDNNTNSSKFAEYRDRDAQLLDFRFNLWHPQGWFLDAAGANVTRRDQSLRLAAGDVGAWRLDVGWNEIPHLFSNKAQSPYSLSGPGSLTVTQLIVITFKKLNTAAVDTNVPAQDNIISTYAQSFVRPTSRQSTKTGTAALLRRSRLDLRPATPAGQDGNWLSWSDRRSAAAVAQHRAGRADRYRTGGRAAAGFDGGSYQPGEYLFGFRQPGGRAGLAERMRRPRQVPLDTWDRLIGAGRRPPAPDNRYHNLTFSGGINLPLDSRKASTPPTAAWIRRAVVPYAYRHFWWSKPCRVRRRKRG